MKVFNAPAYPAQEFDPQLGVYRPVGYGLTIRQQAVLMMAAAMIKAGVNIFMSGEELTDHCDAACNWADAVLRAERESRDE